MDPAHLTELATLEDTYWWHVAKRELAVKLLKRFAPAPGRLAEGGIGSGRNLLEFQSLGYDVTGFDVMEESVAMVRDRGVSDVRVHDLSKPWPVPDGSLKAIVLLDVLEHVEESVAALKHARNALSDDGAIILTVPAYQWLYGRWDEQLGHFRRYTGSLLRNEANAADLRVAWMNHWNSFTLPAALAVRTWERMFPRGDHPEFPEVSRTVNRMLLSAASAERMAHDGPGVPAGLSLAGVLTR